MRRGIEEVEKLLLLFGDREVRFGIRMSCLIKLGISSNSNHFTNNNLLLLLLLILLSNFNPNFSFNLLPISSSWSQEVTRVIAN